MSKTFLIRLAPWALSSLLAAGCGGGGDAAPQASASRETAATASVQLEGCVVTSQWMGEPDRAVHARTADGRIVGTAFTNRQGVFVITVPARSDVLLDTTFAGPGEISLKTGSGPVSLGACLLWDL